MTKKGYTPCALVRWGNDRDVKLWMGHPEESCEKAFLTLAYLIEEQHAEPLVMWVDADGDPEWLGCYVNESGKQTKTMWGIIQELKELAASWEGEP